VERRQRRRHHADQRSHPPDVAETIIPEDAASTFVAATLADIRVGGDMAGYIPSKDYITLPPAAAFKSMESYYATTFHELGHWSGAEKRLDRNLTTRFGTEAYAAEELVAELTSAFLCAELGVQRRTTSCRIYQQLAYVA
jgi:antirestriction protein ArdC